MSIGLPHPQNLERGACRFIKNLERWASRFVKNLERG
jgi:hypothetical protein